MPAATAGGNSGRLLEIVQISQRSQLDASEGPGSGVPSSVWQMTAPMAASEAESVACVEAAAGIGKRTRARMPIAMNRATSKLGRFLAECRDTVMPHH